MNALTISNLTVEAGGRKLLREVSYHFEPGNIYGVVGANGSGKTSFLNALCGLGNSHGKIQLRGRDISHMGQRNRHSTGFRRMWQHSRVFENLTLRENLLVASSRPGNAWLNAIYNASGAKAFERQIEVRAEHIMKKLGLGEHARQQAGELSTGQKKLLAFGQLLMTEYENGDHVFMLDEPFAGVNRIQIEKLKRYILELKTHSNTVLLVEHSIDDLIEIVDVVLLMQAGSIAQSWNSELGTHSLHKEIISAIWHQ